MNKYRAGILLLVAAGLVSLSGASCPYFRRPDAFTNMPPLPQNPSLEQLIQLVNANNLQIRSFSASEASVSGTGFPRLRARIDFERPQRFRLRATFAFSEELDVGSNEELFWFWFKQNPTPALYYGRHAQFASSPVRQTLPVDPYWLIEAFGIGEIDPTLPHQGPWTRPDGRLEIRTTRQSPTGQTTKVTLLERHGLVVEQRLYDARNQLIASATTTQHHRDPLSGLVMPTDIALSIPSQQMTIRISLGKVEINRPAANPELWAMPNYPGSPPIDVCSPGAIPAGGAQAPSLSSRNERRYPARAGIRN